MTSTLPAEVLIDKLVSNSQKTLSSLRDAFTYEKAIPVPSSVPLLSQDEIEIVPHATHPDANLRECKQVNKHMPAFDECIFHAAGQHSITSAKYYKFRLDLLLDIPDLMEFDGVWATKVLHGDSYTAITAICYEILRDKIQDDSLLPEYFFLNLGFKRIPSCFYLDFRSVFQKRSYLLRQRQPVIVMGTIYKEYEPILELISSTFTCVNVKCRNKDMMAVQRQLNGIKVVKRSEDQELLYYEYRNQLLNTDTQCTHCGERMIESMVDRVCNQYKKVQIEAFDQNGAFSNYLMIKLSNRMISAGQPGDQVEVIGFVDIEDISQNKKINYRNSYSTNIVASSIQKIHQVNGAFDLLQNSDLFGLSDATLPPYITEILESERSPYSTGQTMVSMFLNDWLPDDAFRKMRLSLLMSLVSTSPEEYTGANVNVMIVSDTLNSLIIRILNRAGRFKRFMIWNFTTDVIPITDGIVFVQIKNFKDLRKLVTMLRETRNKKTASIWGLSYAKDIVTRKDFKEAIGSFDIVLNLCHSAYSHDEELADCVIKESLGRAYPHSRNIDTDQFQKYLYISSSISVSVTPEAEEVLSLYLAALRNRGVESFNNYDISLQKLIRISEAHAKLCLRNKILVDDSIISVLLAEESLAFLSGDSLMGFKSLPQDQENLFFLFHANDDCVSDDSFNDPFKESAFIRFYEDLQKFF